MNYKWFVIKRGFENILICPFVLAGKILGYLHPFTKNYTTFIFFPFYHTGGAEKVHYNIAKAIGSSKVLILFTRKSINENYKHEFASSGCAIIDISFFTDNKLLFPLNLFYRGFISARINRQKAKLVFNGQSNFGYKISPWVKKDIPQVELIHAFNTFALIRLPFLKYYTQSITVGNSVKNHFFKQYVKYKIPASFKEKLLVIENKIELHSFTSPDKYGSNILNILYVGRGTSEKRVHLVAKISEKLNDPNKYKFLFAGDVKDSIPEFLHKYCHLLGDLSESELAEIYQSSHILLITSSTESGPFVFMEAMAAGNCIISTPVGYIPDHIKNHQTGFVLPLNPEDNIIQYGCKWVEYLYKNREELKTIGLFNVTYANQEFDINIFKLRYQNIFNNYLK